jgi:hypothetical protein
VAACDAGWADCDQDPATGCEANVRADAAHCTDCDKACDLPHAVPGCANGCYLAACEYGWDDCDHDPTTGCETAVATDGKNCGACGHVCPAPAHATAGCANGACVVDACDPGFLDCDRDPANGCELDGTTDAKNCGACGRACDPGLSCVAGQCTCLQCNIPHASAACVANQCVFSACNAGWADCNSNLTDGCEVHTDADSANCGACGSACPPGKNCSGGQCVTGFCHDIGYPHCPTGAMNYCQPNPISKFDSSTALYACMQCYGHMCYQRNEDSGGLGYSGFQGFTCGDPVWGYQVGNGGQGDAGRVWAMCRSCCIPGPGDQGGSLWGRWADP